MAARLRLTAAALGAVAWVAALLLVLDTTVPGGLGLPAVDTRAVFGADVVEAGERYGRVSLALRALSAFALLAALAVYARVGARLARESAAGPIGTGMLLGMLGLGVAWLARLPFAVAGHWWERRHGLARDGYLDRLLGGWLELGGTFLFACLVLLVAMALARPLPRLWWLPAAVAFTALAAGFALVSPWLAPRTEPLRDPALVASARSSERALGLPRVPVRVEDVAEDTSLANAYAFGLGPTRRVVLWDTLVRDFERDEVELVLAHELAHHAQGHIAKAVALFGLLALPAGWVVARATRRRGGLRDPAAVPLALLVLAVFQLATMPLTAWASRRLEAEADWRALAATEDPAAAVGLFRGFAETSLADPRPPALARILLGTHPPLAERVAMAEAWRRQAG